MSFFFFFFAPGSPSFFRHALIAHLLRGIWGNYNLFVFVYSILFYLSIFYSIVQINFHAYLLMETRIWLTDIMGNAAKLRKKKKNSRPDLSVAYFHHQNLCLKILKLDNVFSLIIKTMNYSRSRAFNQLSSASCWKIWGSRDLVGLIGLFFF